MIKAFCDIDGQEIKEGEMTGQFVYFEYSLSGKKNMSANGIDEKRLLVCSACKAKLKEFVAKLILEEKNGKKYEYHK